jgi:hypothetical protein
MRFLSDGHTTGFVRWLDCHLPGCNDNDDPNHDNTATASAPDNDAAPEQPRAPWRVPGVGISI